jgi:hypothetical protein
VELSDTIRRAALFPDTDLPGPPPGSPVRRVEVEGLNVVLPSTHPLGIVIPEQLEEGRIDDVVGAVRQFLVAERREKAIWNVSEAAKPTGLAGRLRAFGMRPCDEPGIEERHAEMVCLEAPPPGPPGLVVREAESFEEFLAGLLVSIDAFEMSEAVRTAMEERAQQLWTVRNEPGSNVVFVALEDDEVVAFAGACFGRATVYLSGSGTRPDKRGRGAYRALVRARWDAAVERDTPVLTVGAGAMSRPILERLGFSVVGWTDNLIDEF